MVPYVRKSFHKHFKDGIHYVEQTIYDCTPPDNMSSKDISINSDFYPSEKYPNAY
jgi:hypothetical protein